MSVCVCPPELYYCSRTWLCGYPDLVRWLQCCAGWLSLTLPRIFHSLSLWCTFLTLWQFLMLELFIQCYWLKMVISWRQIAYMVATIFKISTVYYQCYFANDFFEKHQTFYSNSAFVSLVCRLLFILPVSFSVHLSLFPLPFNPSVFFLVLCVFSENRLACVNDI